MTTAIFASTTITSTPTFVQQSRIAFSELLGWASHESPHLLLLLGIAVALYVTMVLLRTLIRNRLKAQRSKLGWQRLFMRPFSRTRSYFMFLLSLKLSVLAASTPLSVQTLVHFLFTIAFVIQAAVWSREVVLVLIKRRADPTHDPDGTIQSALGVITILLNAVIWAIAAIILLDNLGVNVTALVAGLGIGGIAIGLAAQNIFSDIFAALAIIFDKPFKRGDSIQVGDNSNFSGTVEQIGLKTTRLRASTGEMVILSNTNLLNQKISNLSAYNRRRVSMVIRVIYQTDPDLLEKIPEELQEIVEKRQLCIFGHACLSALSESSIDFELTFNINSPLASDLYLERQHVMLAILARFSRIGVRIALPQQVGYMAGPDGKIVQPNTPSTPAARA